VHVERLQRALARAGVASRRKSEHLILEGRVTVNGRVAELGDRVDPAADRVELDGVLIPLDPTHRYFAFHKPAGVVTTLRDPRGRPDLTAYLPEVPGVIAVGRLDRDTEGLLLLTNDGELANRLMHPSYEVPKTYLAEVRAPIPKDLGRRLRDGVELDDGPVAVDSFRVIDRSGARVMVEVVLHEGRKHIVRRLLEAVDKPVERLVRTAVGDVRLGEQRPGTLRKLGRDEVGSLYKAVGL
jgi:23S rRNA pseudouridine2605 synthase